MQQISNKGKIMKGCTQTERQTLLTRAEIKKKKKVKKNLKVWLKSKELIRNI